VPLLSKSVPLAIAGLLAPTPALAAPTTSLDDRKVLELAFYGTLADTSPQANAVSLQKGSASYGQGLGGSAFKFDGSNALNLGTGSHLQPKNLTAGPPYNGAHLKGLLDDYVLYDGVASTSDVVALTRAHNPEFDGAPVAQADAAALALPAVVEADFGLPSEGGKGSALTWTSDSAAIVVNGDSAAVRLPFGAPATVKLTATATYAGASATRSFEMTVPARALPPLAVSVTAGSRCVAGKAVVTVEAFNQESSSVGVNFTSPFSQKAFTAVQSGKRAVHAFATRQAVITAGSVTAEIEVVVDGQPVMYPLSADYTPRSC
jgi:hypothetical protein